VTGTAFPVAILDRYLEQPWARRAPSIAMTATANRPAPMYVNSPRDEALQYTLERHPYLRNRNLRFETREGRVILRGTVNSYYQKVMAQEIVRRLEGVDEIENQLEVTWS
jgi:hypothetical protein